MDFYFDCYGELALQRLMVADRTRTDAFAAAIKEAVKEGDTVLDLGTGTGLLALLAAQAGAKKVYALDQSSIASVAERLIAANGFADRIEVVNGNASDFQLAEPVDLIVSEWLGHFAFAEAMFDDLVSCRNANLDAGGRMLPADVELHIAPVASEELYFMEGPGFWEQRIHGIDFSSLETEEIEQGLAVKTLVHPEELLATSKSMLKLDMRDAEIDSPWQQGSVSFTAQRDSVMNGFVGWFTCQLSPSVVLDTAPGKPKTHWMQTYFPMPRMTVKLGESIELYYKLAKHAVENRSLAVTLATKGYSRCFTVG